MKKEEFNLKIFFKGVIVGSLIVATNPWSGFLPENWIMFSFIILFF